MKTKNKRKKVADGSVETETDTVPKKYRGSLGSKSPLNQKFEPVNIPGPYHPTQIPNVVLVVEPEGQWCEIDGSMVWRSNSDLIGLIKEEL